MRPPACGQAGEPVDLPEQALALGRWVKWIGGASNQDLAAIEDLAGLYSLAGAHCLDLAADPAVVAAARRGIAWAQERGAMHPWLMVSLSDGPDPHFRKAWFDPVRCPPDCPRPCERVCPAMAIPPLDPASAGSHDPASCTTTDPAPGSPVTLPSGVLADRCYGCGRCLPACPQGLIVEREQILSAATVPQLLASLRPDAIELHTRIGRSEAFAARLAQVREAAIPLRRLAVSCGLEVEAASGSEGRKGAEPTKPDEQGLASELWNRFAQVREAGYTPLWQLDGRPMSGDVGAGTAAPPWACCAVWGILCPPGRCSWPVEPTTGPWRWWRP